MDIKELRLDWALKFAPKRILVIIGPNRAGTTIFKHALCLHPELCHLAGEHEPYIKLADNGYPWHFSDEFHVPNNPDTIRTLIANEMHNHAMVQNRYWMQKERVEAPPFVDSIRCKPTDTFVVKVPQDCYRRGIWEALYHNATITYIAMNRNGHAVINGLLDGWESNDYTARITPHGWWKFAMPPNWSWEPMTLDRCINQYRQSTLATATFTDAIPVTFETFISDWREQIRHVWQLLDLAPFDPPATTLPTLMATDTPRPDRWKSKRPWLEEIDV